MNQKRRVFVEAYLKSWNATQAAKAAGYAFPRRQGSRLLSNVDVQAAVQARISEMAMEADEVLLRLADHARASLADFVRYDEQADKLVIDLAKAGGRDKLHLIKKISVDKDGGVSLELYSAQNALKLLGQHYALFSQRHVVETPDLAPLPELLEAMIEKIYGKPDD